jgi:DNA-binding transcriptional LysR family regulator
MELLQLRYFYESAKHENFAKTAEKYMVPASSVSASIKRLEDELGCKLFNRQSNRIILNENGRQLQSSLSLIFEEFDQAIYKIQKNAPLKTEIRMLVLAMREHICEIMLEYQKLYPNVHFIAMLDTDNRSESEYDIIIDKSNTQYKEYKRHELGNNQICFMAPPEHPLVDKDLVMKDLRHERFITLEYDLGTNSTLFECCKNADFYPDIVLQTNDREYFRRAASEGIGIGLWLNSPLAPAPKNLVELKVNDLQIRHTLYLYQRNNILNDQVKDFIEFLKSKEF